MRDQFTANGTGKRSNSVDKPLSEIVSNQLDAGKRDRHVQNKVIIAVSAPALPSVVNALNNNNITRIGGIHHLHCLGCPDSFGTGTPLRWPHRTGIFHSPGRARIDKLRTAALRGTLTIPSCRKSEPVTFKRWPSVTIRSTCIHASFAQSQQAEKLTPTLNITFRRQCATGTAFIRKSVTSRAKEVSQARDLIRRRPRIWHLRNYITGTRVTL